MLKHDLLSLHCLSRRTKPAASCSTGWGRQSGALSEWHKRDKSMENSYGRWSKTTKWVFVRLRQSCVPMAPWNCVNDEAKWQLFSVRLQANPVFPEAKHPSGLGGLKANAEKVFLQPTASINWSNLKKIAHSFPLKILMEKNLSLLLILNLFLTAAQGISAKVGKNKLKVFCWWW